MSSSLPAAGAASGVLVEAAAGSVVKALIGETKASGKVGSVAVLVAGGLAMLVEPLTRSAPRVRGAGEAESLSTTVAGFVVATVVGSVVEPLTGCFVSAGMEVMARPLGGAVGRVLGAPPGRNSLPAKGRAAVGNVAGHLASFAPRLVARTSDDSDSENVVGGVEGMAMLDSDASTMVRTMAPDKSIERDLRPFTKPHTAS